MRRLTIALVVVLGAAACRDITTLQQSNPGSIEATRVYVPANAALLVNGAISDFECAYTRYVVGSGLLADELADAISSSTNFDYDARRLPTSHVYGTGTCGNNQQPPIYTTLSVARGSADTVIARLKGWTDAEMPAGVSRPKLIGQAYAYAGYSLLLLGEGMCSASINLGAEQSSAQMFDTARTRFDSAIVYATAAADPATVNLATLGRARAYHDLGNHAAAATDAAAIPSTFSVSTSNDAINTRRLNFSFVSINQQSWATVDPLFRNVTLGGNPDPRVAVTDANRSGTATGSRIWTPNKYPALNTPMPVARYAEAQLILAESRAAANDLTGAETAINTARNTRAGMPQYSSAGQTQAQVQAQIVEERRRELFLEGHRLWDIRRNALPLDPAEGATYFGGGLYGNQVCFPLPNVERVNNPNL